MRILARGAAFLIGMVLLCVLALIPVGPAKAADFLIYIDDTSATKNQDFIFQYFDIAPGFKADAPIHIINDASSAVTVELIDIETINSPVPPKPAPANNLLPFVNLALLRDGVVVASGANGAYQNLIDATICVPALQQAELIARFELPNKIGNEAQDTSLWLRYYFRVTTGDCEIVTPPPVDPVTPKPPNTGDDMLPFMVLGGLSLFGIVIVMVCGVLFFVPVIIRRRRGEEKHRIN